MQEAHHHSGVAKSGFRRGTLSPRQEPGRHQGTYSPWAPSEAPATLSVHPLNRRQGRPTSWRESASARRGSYTRRSHPAGVVSTSLPTDRGPPPRTNCGLAQGLLALAELATTIWWAYRQSPLPHLIPKFQKSNPTAACETEVGVCLGQQGAAAKLNWQVWEKP